MRATSPNTVATRSEALDRSLWIDRFAGTVRRIIPELTPEQTLELSERCYPNAYRLTLKGLAINHE